MENPPKDLNLIDTEKGLEVAQDSIIDFDAKLKESENIADPSKKILALLELSKVARRRGDSELASSLNKKAIELDDAQNEFFEKETKFKVAKVADEIARFKYSSNPSVEKESDETIVTEEFPIEQFEELSKEEPVQKKSLRKRLASALNSFLSF